MDSWVLEWNYPSSCGTCWALLIYNLEKLSYFYSLIQQIFTEGLLSTNNCFVHWELSNEQNSKVSIVTGWWDIHKFVRITEKQAQTSKWQVVTATWTVKQGKGSGLMGQAESCFSSDVRKSLSVDVTETWKEITGGPLMLWAPEVI
jgi:uncharacterized Fe-S cluster-containing radical SAM superfamily protein